MTRKTEDKIVPFLAWVLMVHLLGTIYYFGSQLLPKPLLFWPSIIFGAAATMFYASVQEHNFLRSLVLVLFLWLPTLATAFGWALKWSGIL